MKRALPALAALGFLLNAASGCASFRPSHPARAGQDAAAAAAIPRTDPAHTYAVLVNGGGNRAMNYQSHLIHIKQLVALLRETHVDPAKVTIFSGDGADPLPDLATRELVQNPDLWLLPRGGGSLRPEIAFVDSKVEGFTLQAARKDAIRHWFETTGKSLKGGDTLLFYVTDHGEKNKKDLTNNSITLWNESLEVDELRELIGYLDPAVRVVEVMSQCFSGAFARTIYPYEPSVETTIISDDGPADTAVSSEPESPSTPTGNVCGYFSVTADRPAYGCYPENRGKEGIGHSHKMFEALDVLGALPEANKRVQVSDSTPDVPHTSSDFYLEQLLERVAKEKGEEKTQTVDALIAEAWHDRGAWEPEIRLLDRIGRTFGTFSPRSLSELQEQSKSLPDFAKQLRTYGDRWTAALEALKVENFSKFLDAQPKWREWLQPQTLSALDAKARNDLLHEMLPQLASFSRGDAKRYERLDSLRAKSEQANAAAYRAEVRLGAVLRMQTILTTIAGRTYVSGHAAPAERAVYEKLTACEALALGPAPTQTSAAALDAPEPFPKLADERALVDKVMPAWMGIEYRPLVPQEQKKHATEKGAVFVTNVFDESPAAQAGLQIGDIILGPPNAPFAEPHAVREWTMRSEIGKAEPLALLRDDKPANVTLRPAPFPLKLPDLPGPPPVGSEAPPLKVGMFKGGKQVVDAKSMLLFFWATWCLPCKASLPEVLAFNKERGVQVVAITDEDAELLEQFFAKNDTPLADMVAIDPLRTAFRQYGVSGTPTYVLIDDDGVVRYYHVGYKPDAGLGIEGWKWKEATKNK
jgi:thiol-disulfide isomerase/thioredoxin